MTAMSFQEFQKAQRCPRGAVLEVHVADACPSFDKKSQYVKTGAISCS